MLESSVTAEVVSARTIGHDPLELLLEALEPIGEKHQKYSNCGTSFLLVSKIN